MWLFFLFLSVGIVLTIVGFSLDIPLLSLAGTIMIFTLGIGLLSDGLDYKIGQNETLIYGDNFSGDHWDYDHSDPVSVTDAYLFQVNTASDYGHYDDASTNRFGWLLMALGALAFILSMFKL